MGRPMQLRTWVKWTPLVLAMACSGGGLSQFGSGGNGGNSNLDGSTGTGSSGSQNQDPNRGVPVPNTTGYPVEQVTPVQPTEEACEFNQAAGAQVLDMFIMEDKSLTMTETTATGETKWEAITEALQAFFKDPASNGIGVGLGFFAIFTAPKQITCDVGAYAKPVVPMGQLNGVSSALADAIGKVNLEGGNPGGETPTRVALEGAIQYAKSWATEHPTHRVIVVLGTDGLPNVCESSMEAVTKAAENGFSGSPSIQTYVIGILPSPNAQTADGRKSNPNDDLKKLNTIAAAGHTGTSFVVDTAGKTKEQFVRAMNAIRSSNQLGCAFNIPPGQNGRSLDLRRASIAYGGRELAWHKAVSECGDGFYYDNNNAPRVVHLCPSTCSQVQANPASKIDIRFSCPSATGELGGSVIGETGGVGGEPPPPACLVEGQSCTDGVECCTGMCVGGICGGPIPK